jgi:hypothetical protein
VQLEDGMQKYWKSFDHYFMVLRDFAMIGDEERQLLLSKHVPGLLIDFYLGEESPLRYLHGKVLLPVHLHPAHSPPSSR